MKEKKFEKTDTQVCKGLAIIFMLIHHLFLDIDVCVKYGVVFTPFSSNTVIEIAKVCKICVSMFVFLTAYGITRKYSFSFMEIDRHGHKKYLSSRLLKLMSGYVFIYILSQVISYFTPRTRVLVYGESFFKRIYYTIIDGCGLAYAFDCPTYNATWWYMTMAIFLILVMPFIYVIVDKLGVWTMILIYMIPLTMKFFLPGRCWNYILCALLGTICAKNDLFEKLSSCFSQRVWAKFIKTFFALGIIAIMSILYLKREHIENLTIENLTDPIMSFTICWLGFELLSTMPFVGRGLAFVGKHSMNIFLTHTFIYYYYGQKYIYSCRYFGLVVVVLLICSLILSMGIEELKKWFQILWIHISEKTCMMGKNIGRKK